MIHYNIHEYWIRIMSVKKMLEDKNGKLLTSKPLNDDNGIVDNKQQKYIKQLLI